MKVAKLKRNALFYIFCISLILTTLVGVSVIPFGNPKYSDQLYLITSDRGYSAIKQINPDSEESIVQARVQFKREIAKLQRLYPPFRLIGLIRNTEEVKAHNKYIEMYTDFYNGPYFKYLETMASNISKRKDLSKQFQEKNTELSSYTYVNDRTKELTSELYDINGKLETIDKENTDLNIKANNVYTDFTRRVDTYVSKGIDIEAN